MFNVDKLVMTRIHVWHVESISVTSYRCANCN